MLTGINNINTNQDLNIQGNKETLSKDDFLKLLMIQIKNQDPLKPMNPAEFTNQLTQLAQLEQSYNFTNTLKDFGGVLEDLKKSNLISLLGKNITFKGNIISADGKIKGEYYLPFSTSQVQIKIFDSSGKEVRTLTANPTKTGFIDINWDGKDKYGKKLNGNYTFQVIALNAENKAEQLDTYSKGIVSSIDLESNKLFVSDYAVDLKSLTKVETTG